jgi:hypothetical protein
MPLLITGFAQDRVDEVLSVRAYSSLMLDPLTAVEIQALRLKLQLFASRQTDATVRSQCHAVDTRLAEVLEGDDPILRQVLANSVEELEEALRRSRIEKATVHFLTGLRRWGYSAPYVPQAGSAGPALRG